VWPNPFSVTLNTYLFPQEKSGQTILAISEILKAVQSEQSPDGGKFAQSGHPAWKPVALSRRFLSVANNIK
jgi:hypothetical protein